VEEAAGEDRQLVLHGAGDEKVKYEFRMKKGAVWEHQAEVEGRHPRARAPLPHHSSESGAPLDRRAHEPTPVPECRGMRCKPATLAVKVDGRNIGEWCAAVVERARRVRSAALHGGQATIAAPILKEIARGSGSSRTWDSAT
jgi:excinuclease ABC subunit A